MLLILEGVDGAGKTTLAETLQAECCRPGTEIIHFGPPQRHPLAEYERELDDYVPGADRDLICDRFHWGEMIYSELYRQGSQLGGAGFWHVEAYLRSRGALMLHVTADLPVIEQRLAARGEDYLQSRHVKHVWDAFSRHAELSAVDTLTVLTDPELSVALDYIRRQARLRELEVTNLAHWPSYVGPIEPMLLLVGEEPNTQEGPNHEAAFVPYPATSGRYLIENVILPFSPMDRARVGLVNAFHHGHEAIDVRGLYEVLDNPPTVALGKVADAHLSELRVPHRTVPHPQFWRRFHYHSGSEYRQMILEALP